MMPVLSHAPLKSFDAEILTWLGISEEDAFCKLVRVSPELRFRLISSKELEVHLPGHLATDDIRDFLPDLFELRPGSGCLILSKEKTTPAPMPNLKEAQIGSDFDLEPPIKVRKIDSDVVKAICAALHWESGENQILSNIKSQGANLRLQIFSRAKGGGVVEIILPQDCDEQQFMISLGFAATKQTPWNKGWEKVSTSQPGDKFTAEVFTQKAKTIVSISFAE